MTKFDDVVEAWQQADVQHIHPLRTVSEDAYWKSGQVQAHFAASWFDKGSKVMDFGCGDGRLAIPLAGMDFEVVAVDSSPAMLDRVRKRAKKMDVELTTVKSDGRDLSKKVKGKVDGIVCRAVLIHHDYEGVEALVKAFASVLKKGGHLVADWPLADRARPHERRDWIDVTTWEPKQRLAVAEAAGLAPVGDETPSVWVKL